MRPLRLLLLVCLAACGGKDKTTDCTHTTATGSPTGSTTSGTPTGSTTTPTTVTIPATVHQNLLFISIDTFRKDHIGRYDPDNRNLTPFLDSLLAEAVVAENHETGSNWTYHAMSTALSGRYPLEQDVLPRVVPSDPAGWPAGERFIADELGDAGFHTIMASANGWLAPQYGLSVGYDSYLGNAFDPADTTFGLGRDALQAALDGGGVDRWHLHLHFLEPHAPYNPPSEYRIGEDQLDPLPWNIDDQTGHYQRVNQWPNMTPDEQALLLAHLKVRYEGEIRWLDDRLESFWTDMDSRGWLDDTLVVFFTDHGEQFWERGNQSHAFHVYPEETDGLFALWSPKFSPTSFDKRSSGVNIAPTAFRHLDLTPPASWTGESLSDHDPSCPVFNEANGRLGVLHSVTQSDKQLIYRWTGQVDYYDLATDPGRTTDVFDENDPDVQALWELLRPRIQAGLPSAPAQTPIPPPGLSL